MEDFSEEFKEERRLKFSENYWKTGIDLSSLVGDFERIELLTGAQKAMIPRKDIKQLKINMKWKGPIKRAKEYDSGQVLIGLANIEDIDKLSSCFGLLLTRIEYDKKLMREITKPEKLVLDRDLFEENIMNTAYSLRNEFIKVCDDPYVSPKILKPIGKKWYEMYKYFYKIYEDSVEQMYIALPAGALAKAAFKQGVPYGQTGAQGNQSHETITNKANINNPRGIVQMPSRVYSVNNVFEIGGFSGEDGGFGDYSFNAGDVDFSIDKFIYSDVYGAGIGSENLMYYVVNSLFLDNTRQVLLPQISYTFNRLTKKFRFQGELPTRAVIFEIFSTIPDCALFEDEAFQRYVIGQAKIQLARILGTFSFNLPGNITINYDLIQSEGREEVDRIVEEIKGDEGVDYFFTG